MTTKGKVVHVKRARYDVYIGRANRAWSLPQSFWANPFRIGPDGDREEVIAKYRAWAPNNPELMARVHELRGATLGCWCRPAACHGDVLLELADLAGARVGAEGE